MILFFYSGALNPVAVFLSKEQKPIKFEIMKTRLVKTLVMAIFITIGLSTQVAAQKGCDGSNCYGISDLKPDQKTKIEALCTDNAKKNLVYRNQLQEKKAQLNTLMTAEKADLTSINKLIDEMGKIKTEKMKAHAAHQQEIRKILDDKQRLEFDLRISRHGFMGNYGHHGKGMRGEGYGRGNYGQHHKHAPNCDGYHYGNGQGNGYGKRPYRDIQQKDDAKTE